MRRAVCGSPAGPLWPSATRRWAAHLPKEPPPVKVANPPKAATRAGLAKAENLRATGVNLAAKGIVGAAIAAHAGTAVAAAEAASGADAANPKLK